MTFAILSGADLDFASFKGVILDENTEIDPKPKLIWQIVNRGATNAVLTNADLSNAFLEDADLRGAKLNSANLRGSDLSRADIRGANLTGANIQLVSFPGTLLDSNTVISAGIAGVADSEPECGRQPEPRGRES